MYNKTFIFALMAGVALSPFAYAQKTKHDSSIAHYNYNVPIVEDDTPASSQGLNVELDRGVISENAIPAQQRQAPLTPYQNGTPQPLRAPMAMPNAMQGSMVAPAPTASVVQVGSAAPDFVVPSTQGNAVALKDVLARGPALILFTNGTTSPFSVRQLQLLQKNLSQFNALGIQVVAISAEPMGNAQYAQQKLGLNYPILNDPDAIVARSYGITTIQGVTPALFTISADGKVAGVQLQSQSTKIFDLTEATDPIRGGMSSSAVAPTQMSAPTSPETRVPVTQVAPQQAMPAAMPPVPSPQAGKVKFDVPPSNPNFGKFDTTSSIAI